MKGFFKKALAVLLSVLMAVSVSAFSLTASAFESVGSVPKNAEYAEGEVIAVLKNGVNRNYLLASGSSYGKGIKVKDAHSFNGKKSGTLNIAVLKSSTLSTKEMLKQLKKNKGVKYAVPNFKKHVSAITDDTYSKYQWALENTGQNGGTVNSDVNAEGLWDKAASSKEEQIVAVCDTGLDLDHPEFKDIIWTNPYGSKLVGKHGYDFSGENKDCVPRDGHGHGTHCSGIIAAAANNGIGISGINQSNVKILPMKWLTDEGSGYDEDVIAAYDYISRAIDLGANITAINNSWGGLGNREEQDMFDEIFDKLGEKGAVTLIAAGNEESDLSDHNDDFWDEDIYFTPACTLSKYALTVGATNEKDELADFSNYSDEYVDIAAPGVDILSTVSYNCFNPSVYSDEKKAALVNNFQDYEGTVSAGDFGYPNIALPVEDDDGSDNVSISFPDGGFGLNSGKFLTITTNDEIKKNKTKAYAIEIPFTLDDPTQPYSVSLMGSGAKDSQCYVLDVPASTTMKEIFDCPVGDTFVGEGTGNWWSHVFFNSNEKDEDGEPENDYYTEDANRKLVIYCYVSEKDTTIKIDDLAISKQGVDEDEFEKYDFYCGTSMATPYVAGAVALVASAYPDASVFDVINMVKNTGRINENLEGKVENRRILSLENPENIPPMILSAKYDKNGKVEISGSFRDITSVEVNSKAVTPVSKSNSKIVIPDDSYNTKKTIITVTNATGSDTLTVLLSKKAAYPKATDVMGEPGVVYGGVMLPANDKAYYINDFGTVGVLYYDVDMGMYTFEDGLFNVDFEEIFGEDTSTENCKITSAAYTASKIYFTAIYCVTATNGAVIGTDTAFGCIDLENDSEKKLCELPEETAYGGTIASYNGSIYLAGGTVDEDFSDSVYKYNASKKKFDKLSAKLPEGRAYTKFIQYGNKLVGVYGAVKSGDLPSVITFNGSSWSKSKIALSSDDYSEYSFETGTKFKVYEGNLGYGSGGVFCNGAYVYGKGDSFTYNVNGDAVTAFDYSAKYNLDGKGGNVIGTTLPGCFVAFPVNEEFAEMTNISLGKKSVKGDGYEAPDSEDDIETFTPESSAIKINMVNSYATLDKSALKNARVTNELKGYNYGEKATVTLAPSSGYVIKSISVNGKTASNNSNSAVVTFNTAKPKITAATLMVAPAKVKSLKAKVDGKTATLSWKKVQNANGYQVQRLKKGKWKTVKTIKKGKTVKYKAKKLKKGTAKFRVRAYRKYGGKTYYGPWANVNVKIK